MAKRARATGGLADWIERNVRLPEGFCAEPGPMRLWPYQREVANAIGDPRFERVTVQKSARLGFSVLLQCAIGYWCVCEPAPILILLPTESDCRDFMVSDLEPLFAATPALSHILTADARAGQRGRPLKGMMPARNTILLRRFAGGSLKIVAAKAPRNLRRHTAKILLIDEADAMENSAEGDVLGLAEKRTLSFANRKIVVGSTPKDELTSHVCRAYAASDRRVFEVPCPECKTFTEIEWGHIEWPPGEPSKAAFRCPACQALVPHARKGGMLAAGRWRATAPSVEGHAGFRINALVSPLENASWGKLAQEFLAAKDDPAALKPFINTVLAQPWREQGDELDDAALAGRAEPFGLDAIPREVLCITVGVDVQHDRLECTFAGFARDGTCFVLGHRILHGPTDRDQVWIDLDDLLKSRWPSPLGGSLAVDAATIDAGDGHLFDKVLQFCNGRSSRRIWAIKGVPGLGKPAFKLSTGLRSRGAQRLYLVGVDGLKSLLFERLKRGRSVRFSSGLEPDYFDQICSERKVEKFSRGRPQPQFVRIPGKRAEALDCLIYAQAARQGLALNLAEREARLRLDPPSAAPPRVVRSRWLDEGRV